MPRFSQLPPLALYLHFPWCVRKCPYCDFNSHELGDELDERTYIDALLADLEQALPRVWNRPVVSVFMGGGTPSLFAPESLERLLGGLRARLKLLPGAEITLEANPGTVEQGRFEGYRAVGINRLSLGIQSFHDPSLQAIGRIHSAHEAVRAVESAHRSGLDNLNLDLMFGLPGQDRALARADLEQALALEPQHLSYYQLTLEPNTAFAHQPPVLPDDELRWAIQEQGEELLGAAGFEHYEISGYARPGRRCRHNLNYWQFGDYLGLGAGAHGKLSDAHSQQVSRHWKLRHPQRYLEAVAAGDALAGERVLGEADLILEFMMNALRLHEGFTPALFETHTGLPLQAAEPALANALARGLLERTDTHYRPSQRGRNHLNELLQLFLKEDGDE